MLLWCDKLVYYRYTLEKIYLLIVTIVTADTSIVFVNVNITQKIADGQGGFTNREVDGLGSSIANIGDLNGDNIQDLAVAADYENMGQGAMYIFFMNSDGTVKSHQKISDTKGDFTAALGYFWCIYC